MQMVCIKETQFAGLNGKRFYFNDAIVLLSFGHFLLNKIGKKKEKYKTEIQYEIHEKKYDFLKEEAATVKQYERLRIPGSIFSQPALHCVKHNRIRSYSGLHFPAFGLNAEKYEVSLRIHSECGKMRTRTTPNTDSFHAALLYKLDSNTFMNRTSINSTRDYI